MDRNVRLLKAAVYTMGVMLVVGTIVLVAAIIWKASRLPAAPAAGTGSFEPLDIPVPPGAAVRSVEIDGDRMAVTIAAARDEIIIVDLTRGTVTGRITLTPEGGTAPAP